MPPSPAPSPRSRRRLSALALAAALGAVTLGAPSPAAASASQTTPASQAATAEAEYLVGRGIADVTGEAAETGMMGYSSFDQKTSGIHQRQRSRAYVVVDRASGKRVVYVNADLAMIFQSVRQGVLARLQERYGSLYGEENVLLSATHTHSGPGGYSHHVAYNLSVLGFQNGTYQAIVDGIAESVAKAHDDLKPGSISLGTGTLTNASVNRSREAFDRNPAADRAAFPGGIDPAMTVLRFRQGSTDAGAISWFATHNTSITNENTLISPDNKGYASYAWEHDHEGVRYLDNTPGFVAAFPNTNAGDMSPNLNLKPGSGPTEDEFENARIIGERQLDKAREVYRDAQPVSGGVDARLTYVDMENVTVSGQYTSDGKEARTCPAVVGASTLAGSVEDGPAIPGFEEGMRTPVAGIIDALRIDTPSWLATCQYPKASLIPTGLLSNVHPVTPKILPLQIMRIGELYLVAGPGEFTITAGLRVRRTVAQELGVPLERVLLQGYANAYSQYVTTPEEYDTQNYEGGSTLYGRHTLPAYQQEYARVAAALRQGTPVERGTLPPDESARQFTFQTGVVYDNPPLGKSFGSVLTGPASSYARGSTATVEFATGHPKNNLRRGGTFLEVQRLEADGRWARVLDDGDWETTYRWTRLNGLTGTSKATVTWRIGADTAPGTYRIAHHGDAKNLLGKITPFTGTSAAFTVTG
ncbi:neutral/alkaline ceramidase [Streptomyces bacillaris]|uniref:neutral/alkaline ceramidase n=1 Tax=Streptomyces bacillaris TaxID=68179 RepID=UPI0036424997